MFVEKTAFDGRPWNLPQMSKVSDEEYDSFVGYLEGKALTNLLGASFYNRLKLGLEAEAPDNAIWLLIRDGGNYSIGEVDYVHGGLKDLLTPYIYSEWIRADFEKYVGAPAVVPQFENSEMTSPSRLICKGWNEYVRQLGATTSGYPSDVNTLYGILTSNELYGEFEYNIPNTVNIFGL